MTRFLDKIEAAPQRVAWQGFKDPQKNAEQFRKLEKDKRKKLIREIEPGIKLYSLPDKFFVLDENERKLIYFVQFKYKMFVGKKGVTQILVWRHRPHMALQTMAEEIFFDLLLPTADCVVTDKQQTEAGQAFWERRIEQAFKRNYHVYLLDLNQKSATELRSASELNHDLIWGDSPVFMAKRVAISKTKLW